MQRTIRPLSGSSSSSEDSLCTTLSKAPGTSSRCVSGTGCSCSSRSSACAACACSGGVVPALGRPDTPEAALRGLSSGAWAAPGAPLRTGRGKRSGRDLGRHHTWRWPSHTRNKAERVRATEGVQGCSGAHLLPAGLAFTMLEMEVSSPSSIMARCMSSTAWERCARTCRRTPSGAGRHQTPLSAAANALTA